jgi:hypothetical protein
MDLDTFLWKNRYTAMEFAKKIDIPTPSIYPLIRRKMNPSLANAIKIVEGSNGQITYPELLKKTEDKKEKNKSTRPKNSNSALYARFEKN